MNIAIPTNTTICNHFSTNPVFLFCFKYSEINPESTAIAEKIIKDVSINSNPNT